jgi:hypothetical protein
MVSWVLLVDSAFYATMFNGEGIIHVEKYSGQYDPNPEGIEYE